MPNAGDNKPWCNMFEFKINTICVLDNFTMLKNIVEWDFIVSIEALTYLACIL